MGKLVKSVAKKKDDGDVFYRVIEMRDGMKEGIANIEKVIGQQEELIQFLKTAPDNKYKDTIVDLLVQVENFKQQKEAYSKKLEKAEAVIAKCEATPELKQLVSDTLLTFIKF